MLKSGGKNLPHSPLGPIGGNRLYSLDIRAQFDMFWILVQKILLKRLAKATGSFLLEWLLQSS